MKTFGIIFYLVLILNTWIIVSRIEMKCDHIIKNQVADYNEFKQYLKESYDR